MERRDLFKTAAAMGAAAAGISTAPAARAQGVPSVVPSQDRLPPGSLPPLPKLTDPGEKRNGMLYRKFGSTGETVSAIGFGGSHFAKPGISEQESVRLCHAALDHGITFMDNSWDYNKGLSEERMGLALQEGGRRNKVFLMSKVDGRDKQTAMRQLEDSLLRLRTDHLDLWQFHETLRYDDPDRIFRAGGALEAALEAKQQGKIRFIGFTGHKDPHVHLYMMEVADRHGFKFDAVLHPSNVMDAHFRSFGRLVMPVALSKGMAVQTMKPFGGADGVILKSNTVAPLDCLNYALNLPTSVVITGIDNDRALQQAVQAAGNFSPMNDTQVAAILAKTGQAAETGDFELFKTSSRFDSTAQNPDWLGKEDPITQQLAPQNAG